MSRILSNLTSFLLLIIAAVVLQAQVERSEMSATRDQAPRSGVEPPTEQTEQWQRKHQKTLKEQRYIEDEQHLVLEKERGTLQKLQQLEAELKTNEENLARYQQEVAENRRQIETLQGKLNALMGRYEGYKKRVAKRIRAMYKVGYKGHHLHTMKVLLGAQNLVDLLHKYKYISSITKADQRLINRLQTEGQKIQQTRVELVERLKRNQAASDTAKAKQVQILARQQEHRALLRQYIDQKATNRRRLARIKAEIAVYEKRLGPAGVDAGRAGELQGINRKRRGHLPWPATGEVIPNQTELDRGITIRAANQTPVRSVADGIVAKTIPSIVGYGNTVLITHKNGYISVYAHLSEILVKESEFVESQQIIGKVGDTGSLNGAVLYFELWHNYDRLSTQEWLSKVP